MLKESLSAKIRVVFSKDIGGVGCFIRGIGVDELMPEIIIDRPYGTDDYFLVYFYTDVTIHSKTGRHNHPAGSWILWSDKDAHYYGSNTQLWTHTWVHFYGNYAVSFIKELNIEMNKVYSGGKHVLLDNLFENIYNETIHPDPEPTIIRNHLQNLLIELSRRSGINIKNSILPEAVAKIKKILDKHPEKRYSLKFLAKTAGISVPHLSMIFKKHLNISPIDYHIGIRLQRAKYYLLNVNYNISDIATLLGYQDIYAFSKQFKKYYGVAPSQLRQSKKGRML
jgi:AraC-like DNA-binding protein